MSQERTRTALNPGWSERFMGGSQEKEAELLDVFAQQIQDVQERNRKGEDQPIRRGFHAKLVAGIVNAQFIVAGDVRAELQGGLFVPGRTYPAVVRLSNASGIVRSDSDKDLRGIAIRIEASGGAQDFLFTNSPASHARDARQFMAAATAMAGGRRLSAVPRMVRQLGLLEGLRVVGALRRASRRVGSLATEAYFSRAPFAVGRYAVKFKLQPVVPIPWVARGGRGPDALRDEFVERLRSQDVRYHLQVLHYVDEQATPIEDGTVEWTDRGGPPEIVAELLIPRQDLTTVQAREGESMVDALQFNPWSGTAEIRPIGSLNRARKPVYQASARLRSQDQGTRS
jgi:catalase